MLKKFKSLYLKNVYILRRYLSIDASSFYYTKNIFKLCNIKRDLKIAKLFHDEFKRDRGQAKNSSSSK